jgi:hypothetical protein
MKPPNTVAYRRAELAVDLFSGWPRRDFLHGIAPIAESST